MKTISTPQVTLLGITIDWKLLFNGHVDNLCNLARSKTGALMRLRKKLTIDKKLLLYNSFIKSQFGYCPCVWMFHGKTTVNKVYMIKKRALRAVYNDFTSTYEQLLAKGNHDTIHQTNLKQLIVKVYKCLRKEVPEILHTIFNDGGNINYNLRINNLLILTASNRVLSHFIAQWERVINRAQSRFRR